MGSVRLATIFLSLVGTVGFFSTQPVVQAPGWFRRLPKLQISGRNTGWSTGEVGEISRSVGRDGEARAEIPWMV